MNQPPEVVPWRTLALHVWGPLLLAAPALAFPLLRTELSCVLLGAAFLWCVIVSRYGPTPQLTWHRVPSPLTAPVIVVLACAAVGTASSAYPAWSIPKFCGIILGVLAGRAVLLSATTRDRLWTMSLAYVAFGVGIILLGVLAGPDWRGLGGGYLYNFSSRTIPVVVRIPGTESGPNRNALGGTSLFFLPVCAAMLWCRPRRGASQRASGWAGWLAALVMLVAVLTISQSRTAWASAFVVLTLLLTVRFRAAAIAAGVTVVGGATATILLGPIRVLNDVLSWLQPVVGEFDDDRPLIWSFARQAIRDHPWSGVGLGAFREVIHGMTVDGHTYEDQVSHAHNIFLQTTLDLGIVGLAAYVALLTVTAGLTWRVY